MPTLQRLTDCRILMYIGDHPPPHVHVLKSDGRDCIVEIDTLLVIGKIASREIRDALNWIDSNRVFLLSEWQRYNP
jgi:ACT domain-containing protein